MHLKKQDKILDLYNSFLGRFQFFRDFIRLFINQDNELTELKLLLDTVRDSELVLVEEIEKLHNEIAGLKSDISSLTESLQDTNVSNIARDFEMRSPHAVMEKFKNAYNDSSSGTTE